MSSMDQLTCLDIAAQHGIALTQERGGWWVGICSQHDDHRPSLRISENGEIFCCYPCRAKGDVISFVRFLTGCSYQDALAGITVKQDIAGAVASLLRPQETELDGEAEIAFALKYALRQKVPAEAIDQALQGKFPLQALRSALRLPMQSNS